MLDDIPESMSAELGAWNNGAGIPLETWTECEGNFMLAVGYASILWPNFQIIGKYLLIEGNTEENIAGFEQQPDSTPMGVEWVLNHIHLSDLHMHDEINLSADKLIFIGKKIKEMWEAKLNWQFPDRPCNVELYIPSDPDEFRDYQISFWQKAWD